MADQMHSSLTMSQLKASVNGSLVDASSPGVRIRPSAIRANDSPTPPINRKAQSFIGHALPNL